MDSQTPTRATHSYSMTKKSRWTKRARVLQSFLEWLRSSKDTTAGSFTVLEGNNIYWFRQSTLMKFLVQGPQPLEEVGQLTVVPSCFTWNAWTIMQRTQKGIACSLLYGLIKYDMNIPTANVKGLTNSASMKRYSGWFLSNLLKEVEIRPEASCKTACILNVGLDEIDFSEGPASTLGFIDKLCQIRQVHKTYVSNYQEPALKRPTVSPALKFQDLT